MVLNQLKIIQHFAGKCLFVSDSSITSDKFYIQFYSSAFPETDFSEFVEGTDDDERIDNFNGLIDWVGDSVLQYDLSHIKGEEIVKGTDFEHIINWLELTANISD